MLINKCEGVGLKHYNDSKAFIENLNDKDDVFGTIEEYSPNKEHKTLIVFDMIAYMLSNKKLKQIVTELFITG